MAKNLYIQWIQLGLTVSSTENTHRDTPVQHEEGV